MNDIQHIVIQGAGALGALYAGRMIDAGLSVALLARGERAARLRRDGVLVNGRRYDPPVLDPDAPNRPADLVIVAVKAYHLEAAVPDLRSVVGDQTTLISVLNGLDSEAILAAAYGAEKVLYAVVAGIDAVREDNRVTYSIPGTLFVGAARNEALSPRVRALQALLDRAALPYQTPADMIRLLWWKFMVIVGMNPLSAVLRAPYGVFQRSPDAQALMETLMREVIAIAEAAGVNLTPQDIADWYRFLNTVSPEGKPSMLQDIEAGRQTEIDIFAGKVVELGRTYSIPTPVNATLLHMIRVLEAEQGSGRA